MILFLFGFSVIKHSPKAKYGEKDSFDLLFIVITKRNQGRNEGRTKQWVLKQRAQRNTAYCLPIRVTFGYLSYTNPGQTSNV